ncbi:MAG: methylated-DNA--[Desulfovibrionaceae bacterium]|nr:methylated-DNA--[protein]-cysteine S-methyltransferase [Desulfovibrionaceae bacterium]
MIDNHFSAGSACLVCPSPLGPLHIWAEGGAVVRLDFGNNGAEKFRARAGSPLFPLLKSAAAQLEEYFTGRRRQFDLPLNPRGSNFQQRVWRALQNIPYGETRSYRDIAEAAGAPGAFRAVGMANHKNPIAIIIPCHRVIGADGSLTGYAGGLEYKQALLNLERGLPVCLPSAQLPLI